jgi:O-antigen ligase
VTILAPGPASYPPARRATPTSRPAASKTAFGLFLVLTAVLLIRPTEIVADLAGLPIYQAVILGCLVVTFPSVLAQLTPAALVARPITACVVGMAAAIPLSSLSQETAGDAIGNTAEFLKLVAYYLIFIAVVDTPRRLQVLLWWLLGCIAAHTALAVLNFHGQVNIPAMQPHLELYEDSEAGQAVPVARMCGAGLFGNPNDLSRIIAVGIALTAYLAREVSRICLPGLLGLAAMFVYSLTLTQSRGGLLALAATLLTWLQVQFGGKRTAILCVIGLPVFLAAFGGGRQTEMTAEGGTGQQRIQIWLEGFSALRESPLFGIGAGRYPEVAAGYVAHNTFVHNFVELGIIGGTCFLSAVLLALWPTYRLRPAQVPGLPHRLTRAFPFILAIVAGYAVGMMSSSRGNVTPTYLFLGLATVYQRLAGALAPRLSPRLDQQTVWRLAIASGTGLTAVYVFARVMVQWQ